MEQNRVLTLEEVLALRDDEPVWVEHINNMRSHCGIHIKRWGNELWSDDPIGTEGFYRADGTYPKRWRAWAFAQPPTPAELAANPWPS